MRARRLRLRRRLVMLSVPAAVVVLVAAVKMISVVLAGNSAVADFEAGDADRLRSNAAILGLLNVIEPAKAPFAAGTSAVLDGRLDDADARFADALSRTGVAESCPVRINLELVRERLGDIAAWEARPDEAADRYRGALAIVEGAPGACFAGNTDPDPERRAVRDDTAARLAAKMAGLRAPPPPLAPPPPPPAVTPPPPALVAPPPDTPAVELRLEPTSTDPVDRLRRILQDAAR
ncbi:hypothetical protein [Mycolicibacterium sp. XJ1819]